MIEIVHRITGEVLKEIDADNLGGADLGDAYLGGADLRGAYLRDAYLGGAYLGGAYLRGAYLGGAYLGGAYLRDAYLGGAYLRGAYLRGAKMNWQSHQLIAELLLRASQDDIQKRMISGLVCVSLDWCWDKFLAIPTDLKEWALDTLCEYVVDGDGAPSVLTERKAKKKEEN